MSERRKTSHEQLVYDVIENNEKNLNGMIEPIVMSNVVSLVREQDSSIDGEMIRADIEAMLSGSHDKLYLYEKVGDSYVGVEQTKISMEDLTNNNLFISVHHTL